MSDHFTASHRDELLRENRELKDRIKRLEAENEALRADLLLWNEKEVK